MSTEDNQDPEASRNWQLGRSRQLIAPVGGVVVAQYFDIGKSRSLPWKRRPEAGRLLVDLANPARGFDAVVIGEPQRAFSGNQFSNTFPLFEYYGVELWVPEVGGRIDPGSEAHDMMMNMFGGMAKSERSRVKTRVHAAMSSQARMEGRFLGGRPPYGYRLADAGTHPNPAKAADGKRLHKLEVDPVAAPVVQRIFEEYRSGAGLQAVASALTSEGVLCPSASDPARNSHRRNRDGSWDKSAVRAILANPRYTGYEVWNRQRKDEVLIDVEDVPLGYENKMRWNEKTDWIWSQEIVHEPIVSIEAFDAAQLMFDANKRSPHRTPKNGRKYQLSGIMRCGICGRRMQGHWTNDRPYYRCKLGKDDASDHPKNIYVREAAVTPGIDQWVAALFDDEHFDRTCEALAGTSEPDDATQRHEAAIRDQIRDCDRRLGRYRTALNGAEEIAPIVRWIDEVERERKSLEARLGRHVPGGKLSKSHVRALVEALRDIVNVLATADADDKAALYKELGVSLTYHPEGRVAIEALPRRVEVRVGGATRTLSTRPPWEAWLIAA